MLAPREAGPEGSIKPARLSIGGQSVLCTDSNIKHAFSFTPSFRFSWSVIRKIKSGRSMRC
jgi:predicted 3-demethylubiquinone-9 3-methyltransferase (glyoxalase superfamily)